MHCTIFVTKQETEAQFIELVRVLHKMLKDDEALVITRTARSAEVANGSKVNAPAAADVQEQMDLLNETIRESGLQLGQFAKRIGISAGTLSDMVNGNTRISQRTLGKIVAHGKVNPSLLKRLRANCPPRPIGRGKYT